MQVAVVGGGMTGLSLAWFLAGAGYTITVLEAEDGVGGLATSAALGDFSWDRFYHCMLPADLELLALLEDIGVAGEVAWRRCHTGLWMDGRLRALDGALDLLRLPLPLAARLRIGLMALLAPRRRAGPELDRETAAAWLERWCGRDGWERLWKHLLRAKLGNAAATTAARFIHATIARLASARRRSGGHETLGYVHGGYRTVLTRLRQALEERRVAFRTGHQVDNIACRGDLVDVQSRGEKRLYDAVFLTVPSPVIPAMIPELDEATAVRLTGTPYLGVACTVAVGAVPLTRNYILNLADPALSITGVIEMTNLVDRAETAGHTLVYLPRYALSDDPLFRQGDDQIQRVALQDLARVFPEVRSGWLRHVEVHRARLIQPVPIAGAPNAAPPFELIPGRVFVVNTAQLPSCILNSNDCVGLARRAAAEAMRILPGTRSAPVGAAGR